MDPLSSGNQVGDLSTHATEVWWCVPSIAIDLLFLVSVASGDPGCPQGCSEDFILGRGGGVHGILRGTGRS